MRIPIKLLAILGNLRNPNEDINHISLPILSVQQNPALNTPSENSFDDQVLRKDVGSQLVDQFLEDAGKTYRTLETASVTDSLNSSPKILNSEQVETQVDNYLESVGNSLDPVPTTITDLNSKPKIDFDSLAAKFALIYTESNDIKVEEYLDCVESILDTIFSVFDTPLLQPVKDQFSHNIVIIISRYHKHGKKLSTIQSLIKHESNSRSFFKGESAKDAFQILTFYFEFIHAALSRNAVNSKESLSDSFKIAFSNTLKKHLNFPMILLVDGLLNVALDRDYFYVQFGRDRDPEFWVKYKNWLDVLGDSIKKNMDLLKSI